MNPQFLLEEKVVKKTFTQVHVMCQGCAHLGQGSFLIATHVGRLALCPPWAATGPEGSLRDGYQQSRYQSCASYQ